MVVLVSDTATFAGCYSPDTPSASGIPADSACSRPQAWFHVRKALFSQIFLELSFEPGIDLHARSTPRHLPALSQTIDLTPSIRLGLALHEIVIVRSAAGTYEEGGAHERSGGGADLWDFWDVIG